MRCAISEAETRGEVMEEMEERIRNMGEMYLERIAEEVEMNERKVEAEINMLPRTGLLENGRTSDEEEYVSSVPGCSTDHVHSRYRRARRRIMLLIS